MPADPRPSYEDLVAENAELREVVGELSAVVTELRAEVAELRRQLG
jgi:transposase